MRLLLETERLLLRRFTESDVDDLCDLDGDPEVMRFVTGGEPTPRDVIRGETLPRFLRAYERFEGFGVWAAIERSTGEFLGCGVGEDARFLSRRGFGVVAADFSQKAPEITGRRAPEAEMKRVNLTRGLPFPAAHFGAAVASLSLHYFPWPKTVEVLEDIWRCLVPGGHLLARLNSTNDPRYAAARKEQLGRNFYLVDGSPKRLFDRADVDALFSPNWKIEDASERTTNRYGDEKALWEIVAKKPTEQRR